MRILLAGVPFGCENVGDEAILECALSVFREVCPDATYTVSTGDPVRTAARLGVETRGLIGFVTEVPPSDVVPPDEIREIIADHDCFVWCGATGLSDYPHVTAKLMLQAQAMGKKTIVWGVGMNDELTPSVHRVHPGKRRDLLNLIGKATLGVVDAIALEEKRRVARSHGNIRQCLDQADLVVVRDTQSRDEVLKCGVTAEIVVGADSAILQQSDSLETMPLPPGMAELLQADCPRIGLCISAQQSLAGVRDLAHCLDELIDTSGACVVGIPMNPLTDSALMAELAGYMKRRDRFTVLTGEYQPAEIVAVASRMGVVVSSRLHLLILSAIMGVPIVGIARGSKVDNFLSHFNLHSVGSVADCDFAALKENVLRMLGEGGDTFRAQSAEVQAASLQRLHEAKQRLASVLAGPR